MIANCAAVDKDPQRCPGMFPRSVDGESALKGQSCRTFGGIDEGSSGTAHRNIMTIYIPYFFSCQRGYGRCGGPHIRLQYQRRMP